MQLDTVNQRIVMTQYASIGSSRLAFDKFTIPGDFDIRVDYAILNRKGDEITQERIGLGASDIGIVERVSDGYFGGNVYLTDLQQMIGNPSGIRPWPGISTTDVTGTLRLTRDSSGIHAYYWGSSDWQLIYHWPTSTPNYYSGDVYFWFGIWNGYMNQTGMQIAFDNFYLNAPSWNGPGPTQVPEAATLMLMGLGLFAVSRAKRRLL